MLPCPRSRTLTPHQPTLRSCSTLRSTLSPSTTSSRARTRPHGSLTDHGVRLPPRLLVRSLTTLRLYRPTRLYLESLSHLRYPTPLLARRNDHRPTPTHLDFLLAPPLSRALPLPTPLRLHFPSLLLPSHPLRLPSPLSPQQRSQSPLLPLPPFRPRSPLPPTLYRPPPLGPLRRA